MKYEAEIGGKLRTVQLTEHDARFYVEIDGRSLEGEALRPEPGVFSLRVGDRVVEAFVSRIAGSESYRVDLCGHVLDVTVVDRKHRHVSAGSGIEGVQTLAAPMPGRVVDVLVAAGDAVHAGQGVVVVEAMKMQNEVRSPKDGVVKELRVAAGDTVNAGQVLVVVE